MHVLHTVLELDIKIRDLRTDKLHLQQQCEQLQQQLTLMQTKIATGNIKCAKDMKGRFCYLNICILKYEKIYL